MITEYRRGLLRLTLTFMPLAAIVCVAIAAAVRKGARTAPPGRTGASQ